MNVGERIKKIREEKGISQTELAKMAGITKQSLYKYESSIITNIPSSKIELIAERLQTTPSYLMGWTEESTLSKEEKSTNDDGQKENTVVFHRNGQTTELKLSDEKMDMFVKMIEAFKDNDSDL